MGQDYIQQQKIFFKWFRITVRLHEMGFEKSKFVLHSLLHVAGCATVAANKLGYL